MSVLNVQQGPISGFTVRYSKKQRIYFINLLIPVSFTKRYILSFVATCYFLLESCSRQEDSVRVMTYMCVYTC